LGGGALGVRNRFQYAGHLLRSDRVFNNHVTTLEHHVHSLHHLVEGRCGATLLLEPDQTEICLSTVLEYRVELCRELDLSETQDWYQISN
jgi:hypothetical protein